MNFNNISFILHKPQLSENIGLCARAMKNFGFKNLSVIEPKPIFPNDKIIATSVGAKDIIEKAKVYTNLENSLTKTDILISTSARFRNKNIKHISLDELKKINFKKNVSFLFGSEASGLTNNEVSYSDYTLQIPSNSKFRSLNLSHSLAIVAHAVSYLSSINKDDFQKSKKIQSATKKEITNMLKFCLSNLENQNFFKQKAKKPIMIENLRSIFYKMELSKKEIRILSSVFAGLTKKP
ncbi:rRNA methyltransferase [Pelagibacteraceae bacterium GOM-A3]|nr:rRNA methyltransferase [Pelagibacteraceae bacterium GOM-A3]